MRIALLILLMAGPAFGQDIIRYDFNETSGVTAVDSSGNNHNGTLVGGPARVGGALVFAGGSYVEALNVTGLDVPKLKHCGRFTQQPSANMTDRLIVTGNGTTRHTDLAIVGGNRLYFHAAYTGVGGTWETKEGTITQGTNYAICVEYEKTVTAIPVFTINGQNIPVFYTTQPFGTPLAGANKVRIASGFSTNGDFNGTADDVTITGSSVVVPPPPPPPPANTPPTVTVAPVQDSIHGAPVALSCTAVDNGPVTYAWSSATIPASEFTSTTTASTTVTPLQLGAHTVTCAVSDGQFTVSVDATFRVSKPAIIAPVDIRVGVDLGGGNEYYVEVWLDGHTIRPVATVWVPTSFGPLPQSNIINLGLLTNVPVPDGIYHFTVKLFDQNGVLLKTIPQPVEKR